MFHLLVSLLLLTLAHMSLWLTGSKAQSSTVSPGWERASACQIRFLIPQGLKDQHVKGIDSCVAEFRNGKMRLTIDAGTLGGAAYTKYESITDFVEEYVVLDGKKVQIVSYKDGRTKSKRKFIAGLYVVLYEAKPKDTQRSAFLYMTVQGNSEKEIEIAKQIFRSIHFDTYRPFLIEW
jgi:hypothetical protein